MAIAYDCVFKIDSPTDAGYCRDTTQSYSTIIDNLVDLRGVMLPCHEFVRYVLRKSDYDGQGMYVVRS